VISGCVCGVFASLTARQDLASQQFYVAAGGNILHNLKTQVPFLKANKKAPIIPHAYFPPDAKCDTAA